MADGDRTCPFCARPLVNKRVHAVYCSRLCKEKAYRVRNKEQIRLRQNRWDKTEKGKIHREKTKASRSRYGRSWARTEVGKQKLKEAGKRWRESPKGKAFKRNWWKTSVGRANYIRSRVRRRMRFLQASQGSELLLTGEEWATILRVHHYSCAYCFMPFDSNKPTTIDHLLPISRGGKHTKENVVPACKSCNCRKQARTKEEWMEVENAKSSDSKISPAI